MTETFIQQSFDLAVQHHRAGQLKDAEILYRKVLVEQPNHAVALHNLGVIACRAEQFDIAVALISQSIKLLPNWAEARSSLSEALRGQGKLTDAIAACRHSIAMKPDYPQAHNNLANALRESGELEEAVAACRHAIALWPEYPEAHCTLGNALKDKGLIDQAIFELERAVALKPDYAEGCYNLGNALKEAGRLNEAIAAYRSAIAQRPAYAGAHNNLGITLNMAGRLDEGVAALRQSIALKPDSPRVHSNLLLSLHYLSGHEAGPMAHEHRRWCQRHAAPLEQQIRPHSNNRNPERRLRVGYFSPDFREHAVSRFLLPILVNHDRQSFEIFAYSQVPVPDSTTRRIHSCCDGWRDVVKLSDANVAEQIRQDKIDVLVDLAGHMVDNRLLIFARKPAPVQATYLGYPNTTGLSAIDYRLTDALADPVGQTDKDQSERLIRLQPCAWCFEGAKVVPLPVRQEGPITFGCFNAHAKVREPMLKLWSQILQAVPDSRLLLKSGELAGATLCEDVERRMGAFGIAATRLTLRGHAMDYGEHLRLYGQMDIALDTFPYHGTTTTCEAMWMGVPVVSLAGPTHVSRVGVSLLSNTGLSDLVADTPEEYVQIAVKLANDRHRLNNLHSTLRQTMEQSPLMDAPPFVRNIEQAYRQMWITWCRTTSV